MYITVGTGIGVGVVIGGAPLHGLLHPELGHLPRAADWCDFAGVCPFHGRCLEGVASAPALARAHRAATRQRCADDDPVWALEARYLAQRCSRCVLAYAPRRIVLGGGVLRAHRPARARAPRAVAQLAGYVPRAELTHGGVTDYVRRPHLGTRAGLVGAFLLGEAALDDRTLSSTSLAESARRRRRCAHRDRATQPELREPLARAARESAPR